MLQGQGTPDNPLLARKIEFMDITSMKDVDTHEEGFVIVIRMLNEDELYALFFTAEDFKILIKKSVDAMK